MKLVGMLVVAAALIGMVINGVEEMVRGPVDNPADYPDCREIVQHLGTDPEAKCNDWGHVIKVRDEGNWKFYHPGQ